MENEALKDGGKITIEIHAEWPEEDRKELQEKLDAYNAALDAANKKADALMEKMKQMQEISFCLSESQT